MALDSERKKKRVNWNWTRQHESKSERNMMRTRRKIPRVGRDKKTAKRRRGMIEKKVSDETSSEKGEKGLGHQVRG